MIEPTDKMKQAFRAAQEQRAKELVDQGAPLGAHDILDRGLSAVLAIVERDYGITCPSTSDGARCTKDPGHDGGHLGLSPNAGRVW